MARRSGTTSIDSPSLVHLGEKGKIKARDGYSFALRTADAYNDFLDTSLNIGMQCLDLDKMHVSSKGRRKTDPEMIRLVRAGQACKLPTTPPVPGR